MTRGARRAGRLVAMVQPLPGTRFAPARGPVAPAAPMNLTYAVRMTVGLLVPTADGRSLRERGSAGRAAEHPAR
ncbi:hypothetical protein Z951_08250 [Streptomyces sp. PRh5]|nr:hypothetical protein Z951_08250 [Streptomyces sp. PRh5]